jgi:Zinc knuckle
VNNLNTQQKKKYFNNQNKGQNNNNTNKDEEEIKAASFVQTNKKHIKCFACNKNGHYATECPERKKESHSNHAQKGED